MTKKMLSIEDIEAQSVVELPDREELALINVFVTNVLNNVTVQVPITAAANICGVSVSALSTQLANTGSYTCSAGASSFTISK